MSKKNKKEGHLKMIFRATQNSPWESIDGLENIIKMINTYIINRGAHAAMAALVIRWADVCNVSAIKLVRTIVENEILDSELNEMDDQAGIPNKDQKKLSNGTYVSTFLSNKIALLHKQPRHVGNARIYNEIFDIIHSSYLTMYNEKYAMSAKGFIDKRKAIHNVGKNYHLDSILYPKLINSMVRSAYDTFFKKAGKNKKIKEMLLDSVQDEEFSLKLVDDFTADDYDEAIDG